MATYEFECTGCGLVAEFDRRDPVPGHETDQVETECGCSCHPGRGLMSGSTKHAVPCCYPGRKIWCLGRWKRRWSFAIGAGVRSS